MKKTAIVTLSIGSKWDLMSDITHPYLQFYANKTNSDFLLLNSQQIKKRCSLSTLDIGYEKYQLYDILGVYDRCIFFDTDIIVNKKCPNLFEIVEDDALGAFDESDYWMYSQEVDHRERISGIQQYYNINLGWSMQYVNTGVMVLSKKHREAFKIEHGTLLDLREQSQLNFNFKKLGFWIQDIGRRYNFMDFLNPTQRFDSYVLHYAGRGFTDQWHNLPLKIQRMKEDIRILNEG